MNAEIRQQFPSLSRKHQSYPLTFLDGPAGTQVPERVIEAISRYYRTANANSHGFFPTAIDTDAVINTARQKMATFIGAEGASCISFGQNMTSLCYSLSKGVGRYLQPGDEILISQLDHEANRGPWLSLRQQGMVVREIRLKKNGHLDYDDFSAKLNEKTRLVAVGYASNILGTVNDISLMRRLTYQVGAWLLIDAVHYAPHFPIDVRQIGCDFLLCSAYKFYGPHVGILYSKPGLLDRLPTDRLRTTEQNAPHSIETGTLNHAALAGVSAAVDFIASLGDGASERSQLVSAMIQISQHEKQLAEKLYAGLSSVDGLELYGPAFDTIYRAPTLSFTLKGFTAAEVCQALAAKGICGWDGHFYAIRTTEVLGLLEKGGVTRLGVNVYNTFEEIDRTVEAIRSLSKKREELPV